ncbi:MAG: hypothetical protein KDD36_14940, partial [Flavobacteriales bacterium]|nr:hypothetical protein [Flavobacteriales bacterium]
IANLKLALRKGFKNYHLLINDTLLNGLKGSEQWVGIVEQTRNVSGSYDSLRTVLKRLSHLDQAYRIILDSLQQAGNNDAHVLDSVFTLMVATDKSNLRILDTLIVRYGFLSNSLGWKGTAQTEFMIIQHADRNTQLKYLDVLVNAAKNGEEYPANVAMLLDRLTLGLKKKQYFGSQLYFDEQEGRFKPFELIEPDSMDTWRSKLGLMPMGEYLREMNNE